MSTAPPPPGQGFGPSTPYGGSTPDDTFTGSGGPGQPGPSGAAGPGWSGTPAASGPASDSDRLVAMFCHLSGIIATVLSGGLLPFVGPLIVWLMYKDNDPFVRRAAAGSFNFHVVATLAYWAMWLLTLVLGAITLGLALPLLFLGWFALAGIYLWWTVSATLKANRGEPYRYPVEIKVLD